MAERKFFSSLRCFSFLLLLLFFAASASAVERYVYPQQQSSKGDLSPNFAGAGVQYPHIQAAIDDSQDGDIIYLAPGTFTGFGNRDLDFNGKAITVSGLDPNDPNIVAATIIDCNGTETDKHRGFYFHSGEESNSVICGITITNGRHDYGGAIYCYQSSLYIHHCNLTANTAQQGGALFLSDLNGEVDMTDIIVVENIASTGGGVYLKDSNDQNVVLINCQINFNRAEGKTEMYGGGGISCKNVNLDISNSDFYGNFTYYEGGAILTGMNSQVNISECNFSNNRVEGVADQYGYYASGGAICCSDAKMFTLESSEVIKNYVSAYLAKGGGISFQNRNIEASFSINECNIFQNVAYGTTLVMGGGLFFDGTGSILVKNTQISNNIADHSPRSGEWTGGGIYFGLHMSPVIENCKILGNFAQRAGAIFYNHCEGLLRNCIISGNRTYLNKGIGGVLCDGRVVPLVCNCTFVGNKGWQLVAGGCSPGLEVINSIFYNPGINETGLIGPPDYFNHKVTYCNIEGGFPGRGNIDEDPCFVVPGYWDPNGTPDNANDDFWVAGDYHLKSEGWRWDSQRQRWTYDRVTSRCIDAGNPGYPLGNELLTVPPDPCSLWGENLRIDMGMYGGTAEASIPPYDWALLSDMDNSGRVDFADFSYLAGYYGQEGEKLSGDLNRDGKVDLEDISLTTADWLKSTDWAIGW